MKMSFLTGSTIYASLLALGLFSFATIGCSSTSALTLTSIDHHETYLQNFTQAYTRRDANGDTDVVLLDEAAEKAVNGDTAHASCRQIMHIRILWEPTSDMKAVVSNASVKWYVIGQGNPQDVLQYSGIAFVAMDEDEGTVKLKVQNALLKPSGTHGTMTDPVGPSRLEGSFVAHADPEKVNKVLQDIKSTLAAANAAVPAVSSVR